MYQLCRAASIPTEKLMRSAGRFPNLQCCAAAGAVHGNPVCTALRQIVRNLRDDHIRAIHPNRITGPQLKRTEVVQIVQIGAADRCAVHIDRIEPRGQADHSSARRCKLHASECGFIQLICPFERDQAVFMVPGSAETFAICKIVIFHDKTVDRVCKLGRLHTGNSKLQIMGAAGRRQIKIRNHAETAARQKLLLHPLTAGFQAVADQIKRPKLQPPFLYLRSIEFSHAPGCQISRMAVGVVQLRIDGVEVFP